MKKTKLRKRIEHQTSSNRHRAEWYGLTEHFTADEWTHLLEQSQGRCGYCALPIGVDHLIVEHRLSLSIGGSNTIDNIMPACTRCNHRKRGRTCDNPFPISVEACTEDEITIMSGKQHIRLFHWQIPDLIAKLTEYTP